NFVPYLNRTARTPAGCDCGPTPSSYDCDKCPMQPHRKLTVQLVGEVETSGNKSLLGSESEHHVSQGGIAGAQSKTRGDHARDGRRMAALWSGGSFTQFRRVRQIRVARHVGLHHGELTSCCSAPRNPGQGCSG